MVWNVANRIASCCAPKVALDDVSISWNGKLIVSASVFSDPVTISKYMYMYHSSILSECPPIFAIGW